MTFATSLRRILWICLLAAVIAIAGGATVSASDLALQQDESADAIDWRSMPVIPEMTDTAREIYQRGLELGNNPEAFSKVGDCQNVTAFFLSAFDEPLQYDLGEFDYLQDMIDNFTGSFARQGAAVRDGFNAASVLSPLWADPDLCEKGESPLECEYRLHQPSIVVISLETWWSGRPAEQYENYLRQIVEFWIEHGVVPIVGTKASNLEGDHSLNEAIARVAVEYDIPLWNFWASVQELPNGGLEEDDFHLSWARNFFNDPTVFEFGWPWRNLTALQAIDEVWTFVTSEPETE